MRRLALAIVAIALLTSPSSATQHPALALLDEYAAGRHEAVLASLAAIDDVNDAVNGVTRNGKAWIEADGPGPVGERRLALAVFALELANARKYDAWPDVDRLLTWTSDVIREGRPSETERIWHRAAIALHQGMRKWDIALIEPAQRRFPEDRRLAFADVQSKSAQWVRGWRQREPEPIASLRFARTGRVLNRLPAFLTDPEIGGEAELWTGLLTLLNLSQPSDAMRHFAAASRSADPFVLYLANYAAGRVQESAGRMAEAEARYRGALSAIPGSQSASLALATLLFVRGEPDEAYALVEQAFAGSSVPDPFQLYGFGDYWRFPGYLERLRQAVRQ